MRSPLRRANSFPVCIAHHEITDNRIISLQDDSAVRYYTDSLFRKKINNSGRPIYLELSNNKTISDYCHFSKNIISLNLSYTCIKRLSTDMLYVKYLYLSRCPISNISHIELMKSLIELDLSHCSFITDISPAKHVSILNLSFCVNILDFSMLGNVRNLNLTGTRIFDCGPLCNVPNLNLSGCANIEVVSMLKNVSLDLSHCYKVKDVSMLGHIKTLKLNGTNITSVQGLETVESLSVVCCALLQDFSPVYHVPILDVSQCPYITDIRPFRNKILVKDHCYNIKYDIPVVHDEESNPYIRALSGLIIN